MKKSSRSKELGNNLRKARKVLGFSQVNFAGTMGVTGGYISEIERGRSGCSEAFYKLLQTIHNLNIKWLEIGEGEMFLPRQSTHSDPIIDRLINYDVLTHSELGELDAREVRAIKILRKLSSEKRQRVLDQLVDALISEQE